MLAGHHHHHDLAVIIIADLPRSAGLLCLIPASNKDKLDSKLSRNEKLRQYTFVRITLIRSVSMLF